MALGVTRAQEVPGRACPAGPRHQAGVGVQQRGVARVRHRAEDVPLGGGRLGEHGQGLRGVRGDDDGVVGRDGAVAVGDLDAGRRLEHGGDLAPGADLGERRGDPGDVLAGAAGHRAPGRRAEDREHAVVLEEREEVAGRVVQGQLGVAGPDGRDDGLHEVPGEVRREAALLEELAQRGVRGVRTGGVLGGLEQAARASVEAGDLAEHPQVARAGQVAPGREDTAGAERAGPLETGGVVADRHRHVGLLRRHAELGEEPEQGRVGAPVVHDEAGVDRQPAKALLHHVGVGVPAEPVVGLEERDVTGPRGDVRRGQAGDAGADDCHAPLASGVAERPWTFRHHAFSNSNRTTGSDVGTRDPPAGSTVIPAPTALATLPSSTTVASLADIRPAGTMPRSASWSHIS